MAYELQCSRVHVYRWLTDRLLRAYKIGKGTRIQREELDAFKERASKGVTFRTWPR